MINKIYSFTSYTSSVFSNQIVNISEWKIVKVFERNKDTLLLGTGAILFGSWLVYKDYVSLDKSIGRLVDEGNQLDSQEIEELVDRFLEQNWGKLGLPKECTNNNNKRYLSQKLKLILEKRNDIPTLPAQEKKAIIKKLLSNFSAYLIQSHERILSDLNDDENLRSLFGIENTPTIVNVEILGEESHNKGKNPLCICISLESGERIVYKPRSLLPEMLICGTEDSYFSHLGLPTYRVYDKTGEDYGYCEFLENLEEENTFHSLEELQQLYIEFGKIEKAAREIGLGDIHKENVILSKGRPYLIDTEVVLLPQVAEYRTDLFVLNDGGARSSCQECKNHFWLDSSLIPQNSLQYWNDGTIQNLLTHDGMCDAIVEALDFMLFISSIEDLSHQEVAAFEVEYDAAVREGLQNHKNRIVLVSTDLLSSLIREDFQSSKQIFQEEVRKGLIHWGFTVEEDVLEQSLTQFEEDLYNFDVPVFYHVPSEGNVYYGEYNIGTA